MKNVKLIPLALAVLSACADNTPTEPLSRAPSLRPLLSAFPGNNGRIAFAGHPGGGIHTANPDGSDVQQLTTDGSGPAWAPDGSKLAFNSTVDGNQKIYVITADGTLRTQLTFNTGSNWTFPTWSPDGSKIAFQDAGGGGIYLMDSNGANLAPLTTTADFTPSWSPDGARIAFVSTRDGVGTEIYVMNADGSNQIRLTTNSAPDFNPSWSPDGSKIVFSRESGQIGDPSEIYVMNPDGTNPTNLTNNPLRGDVSASWSPDGSKIAFISGDAANADVYVMNADGTDQMSITNSETREFHTAWQPLPSGPVCVLGPDVYTRLQGPPARIVKNFSATPGSYTVDLDDLATSGADAAVTLNGVVIMEGRGTTGEVGPRHKTVTVNLLAANVLQIDLRGKKGSKLQVTICTD